MARTITGGAGVVGYQQPQEWVTSCMCSKRWHACLCEYSPISRRPPGPPTVVVRVPHTLLAPESSAVGLPFLRSQLHRECLAGCSPGLMELGSCLLILTKRIK